MLSWRHTAKKPQKNKITICTTRRAEKTEHESKCTTETRPASLCACVWRCTQFLMLCTFNVFWGVGFESKSRQRYPVRRTIFGGSNKIAQTLLQVSELSYRTCLGCLWWFLGLLPPTFSALQWSAVWVADLAYETGARPTLVVDPLIRPP